MEFKNESFRGSQEYSDSMNEAREPKAEVNPEVVNLSDKELQELRLRLECLMFSVEAECNKRGL